MTQVSAAGISQVRAAVREWTGLDLTDEQTDNVIWALAMDGTALDVLNTEARAIVRRRDIDLEVGA